MLANLSGVWVPKMPSYIANPGDWVKIAIVAYVAVKVVNMALDKIGQSQFKV